MVKVHITSAHAHFDCVGQWVGNRGGLGSTAWVSGWGSGEDWGRPRRSVGGESGRIGVDRVGQWVGNRGGLGSTALVSG